MGDRRKLNICFHGIGVPGRDLEPGEAPYWIPERFFNEVLDEIQTWPHVQISFDDGNASDIRIGLGALLDRGLTASFFVLAGRLDAPGSLTREDVRSLRTAGMTIGSHGMDHRSWRGLSAADRMRELVDARAEIAEAAGAQVDEAALPLGAYDRRLLADLRSLQYEAIHTSDRRVARAGSWIQPRFSVRAGDTIEGMRGEILVPHGPVRRTMLAAKGVAKRIR